MGYKHRPPTIGVLILFLRLEQRSLDGLTTQNRGKTGTTINVQKRTSQSTESTVNYVFLCCFLFCCCLVQFRMVSMRSEKPICAPSLLSDVFPTAPLKRLFQCSSDLTMALSRPFKENRLALRFLFPRLSSPGDRWCDVPGFVPTGSVSSPSTLQHFREANHLRGLLCPPVYLLGHFSSLRHVQGSAPRVFVAKKERRKENRKRKKKEKRKKKKEKKKKKVDMQRYFMRSSAP